MAIEIRQNIISDNVDLPVAYAKDIRYATGGNTQSVYEKIESLPSTESVHQIAASAASLVVSTVSGELQQLENDLGYSQNGFDIQVDTGNISITSENGETMIKMVMSDATSGFNGMILTASGLYCALNGSTAYKMCIDPNTRNLVVDLNDSLSISNQ